MAKRPSSDPSRWEKLHSGDAAGFAIPKVANRINKLRENALASLLWWRILLGLIYLALACRVIIRAVRTDCSYIPTSLISSGRFQGDRCHPSISFNVAVFNHSNFLLCGECHDTWYFPSPLAKDDCARVGSLACEAILQMRLKLVTIGAKLSAAVTTAFHGHMLKV